jgi:hypothetical protein
MKVRIHSADEAAAFIRECMLQNMRRNIAVMEQSGCSQEQIRLMIAAALEDIAAARIDVADAFNALQESFHAPRVLN